jgi:hypothetical protein
VGFGVGFGVGGTGVGFGVGGVGGGVGNGVGGYVGACVGLGVGAKPKEGLLQTLYSPAVALAMLPARLLLKRKPLTRWSKPCLLLHVSCCSWLLSKLIYR